MVSEETKESIIDKYYQGESKDDNAYFHDVSTGTVFNTIKEHEALIGKNDRESIRTLAKLVKKNNISFDQISRGIKTNSILGKNNLRIEGIEHLFSMFSKLTKEKDLAGLIEQAGVLLEVRKTRGQTFTEIASEHKDKSQELEKLRALESSKKKAISNLDVQHEKSLKRNNQTEKAISDYLRIKENLAKFGVLLDESPKLAAKTMREIEILGYNSRKLAKFLQDSDSLNDYSDTIKSEIRTLQEKRDLVKKEAKEEQETLDFAKSEFSQYMADLKSVTNIEKLGFKTEDLLNVGKLVHKNGFTLNEFVKVLDNFEDIHSFIDSLIATKETLEEQADTLSTKVDSLGQERTSLEEIKKKLDYEVMEKISKIKEDIATFKGTGPLREVYSNSGDSIAVITSTIIFLNALKRWINFHISNPHSIEYKIEETQKLLEKVMTKIAA